MTTYKLTIPIKCLTLHRVKNKIVKILWAGFKVLLVVTLLILNLSVFLMPSIIPRARDSYVEMYSVGAWYNILCVILMDVGALFIICGVYDLHFKIDCLRGDKE
jgi:hypothetical protein